MLRIMVAQELQHKNCNVASFSSTTVIAVCTGSVRSMYYPTPVLNVLAVLFVSVCTTSVSSVKCTGSEGKKRKKKSGAHAKDRLTSKNGVSCVFCISVC